MRAGQSPSSQSEGLRQTGGDPMPDVLPRPLQRHTPERSSAHEVVILVSLLYILLLPR